MYTCLMLSGVLGNLYFKHVSSPVCLLWSLSGIRVGGGQGHVSFMETPVAWTVNCLISPFLLICAAFSDEYFFL